MVTFFQIFFFQFSHKKNQVYMLINISDARNIQRKTQTNIAKNIKFLMMCNKVIRRKYVQKAYKFVYSFPLLTQKLPVIHSENKTSCSVSNAQHNHNDFIQFNHLFKFTHFMSISLRAFKWRDRLLYFIEFDNQILDYNINTKNYRSRAS